MSADLVFYSGSMSADVVFYSGIPLVFFPKLITVLGFLGDYLQELCKANDSIWK